MDKEFAFRLVEYLQRHPLAYRNFGWLWWHIKSKLKGFGFGPMHLNHLGDYSDSWATQHYEGKGDEILTAEAIQLQTENAQLRWEDTVSTLPDGHSYIILDLDVE